MMEPRNNLQDHRLNEIRDSLEELASITESNLKILLERLVSGQIRELVPMRGAAMAANNRCQRILALHTLCAGELRFTLAAVRIIQDYEQIAPLFDSIHRHFENCSSLKATKLLMNFKTSLTGIIDLQNAVQAISQLPKDFERMHLCVHTLSVVAEAGLEATERTLMDIILKDAAGSEDLFELMLACRNLTQLTTLLESIPDEFRALSAVGTVRAA